jgi:uncharacterized protein YlxW (UPF0749 family)
MTSCHATRATLVGMSARPHRRLRGRRTGGPDGAGETGARRSVSWRLATPVVGVLSGALFVVSAHSSEGTDLRPGRYTDLASLVRGDAGQVDALKKRVVELNAEITTLSGSIGNKQVAKVNRQAESVKGDAGLTPVTGPGVTVTLSDAPQGTSATTPDNQNLLLVHQQDIQAVVNAMWKAGALAVTVEGQRIVSTTGIRCIGNSVQLAGQPYSPPYVISAVGDPASLTDSLAKDTYLQIYREDAADPDIAVGWDEQLETRLVAPAYDGLLGLSYASVLPAGDSTS